MFWIPTAVLYLFGAQRNHAGVGFTRLFFLSFAFLDKGTQ